MVVSVPGERREGFHGLPEGEIQGNEEESVEYFIICFRSFDAWVLLLRRLLYLLQGSDYHLHLKNYKVELHSPWSNGEESRNETCWRRNAIEKNRGNLLFSLSIWVFVGFDGVGIIQKVRAPYYSSCK
ncbi:hypothetical protein KSP40_PGU007949 [Platanthera guangdongensis]|uniref:Uncharacterized protein n=1 Tax=Platanthera guangdongensis TaxID=2320717 RepID=A0ABR2M115_9ASPA